MPILPPDVPDPFGSEIEPTAAQLQRFSPTAQLGVSGLRRYGYGRAHIFDDPLTPQLSTLGQRIALLREMAASPILGSALTAIELLIVRTDWRVEPFDDDPAHKEVAEHVEQCLFADMVMTWSETLFSILSGLWAGFSLHETIWKRRNGTKTDEMKSSRFDDGRWGLAALDPRSPLTLQGWVYDRQSNRLIGVRQLGPPTWREIILPTSKLLHFRLRPGFNDNPEGVSLLRNAVEPYFRAKRYKEIEAIGAERDLAGIPKATGPAEIFAANASPAQIAMRQALEELVRNVKFHEKAGLVFPRAYDRNNNELYSFELLSSSSNRTSTLDASITREEVHCARVLLADFMALGTSTGAGSFALSADKTSLFMQATDAIADALGEAFNRQVIPRLMKLNDWDPAEAPRLVASTVRRQDAAVIADLLSKLAQTGLTIWPDDTLEDHVRQVAELPPVTDKVREQREAAAAMQQEQGGEAPMDPGTEAAWGGQDPGQPAPGGPEGVQPGQEPPQDQPNAEPQAPEADPGQEAPPEPDRAGASADSRLKRPAKVAKTRPVRPAVLDRYR